MADALPVLAARYRLDGRIAVGGVGEVWRAEDLILRRPVALKLLRPEYAGHDETLARFRSEARHAASLSHPGIAQVYDYNESGDPHQPFLVMELIDGPSLADVLAGGPLAPGLVMDIVAQAAVGLDAAHRSGLVHRDIKPANLLLAPGGQVKITDFGIAHAAGSAPVTRQGLLIGTPAYLAPERLTGAPATPASDLYSLGILAYECLAGSRPYAGTPMETALAHGQRPLPPLPASVPAPVAAFVTELAAKDPAARPASAARAAARAAELRDAVGADLASGHGLGLAAELADPVTMTLRHPATLADLRALADAERYDHAPREPGPQPHGGRYRAWPAHRVVLAIAAASVIAGLAGWLLSGVTGELAPTANPSASQPATSSTPASGTVLVQAGALVGQPVRVVVRELRSLGLRPQVSWAEPTDQSPAPGTVISVQPSGLVGTGSTITVTAVLPHHRGHRPDHGQGDHGNGQGHGGD